MSTTATILNLINKIDVKNAVLGVISDTRYQVILENIIKSYTLGAVVRSDIVNIIDKFALENPSLTFDSSIFINSIWQQLVNLQKERNEYNIKKAVIDVYDIKLKALLDSLQISDDEYKIKHSELLNILNREIAKIDTLIIDDVAIQAMATRIGYLFTVVEIEPVHILTQVQEMTSLNILKNNIGNAFLQFLGYLYEPIVRGVIDTKVTIPMSSSIIDDVVSALQTEMKIQFSNTTINTLRTSVGAALNEYKIYSAETNDSGTFTATPESMLSGSLVIQETMPIATTITPTDPTILVSSSTTNVVADITTVEEKLNLVENNVNAKIIEPVFKVNVCGTDCGIDINPEDTGKVLTNDGETPQWDWISNIIGPQMGFLKIVETLGDRNKIPLSQRAVGMLVYVKSRDSYYKCESNNEDSWTLFKQGLYPHRLARTVIFENVKLGHGDKGSDMRISDIKSTVITTTELKYLDELADVEYANLISFKNVGYKQAEILFDGNKHLLNPNSVFELPFDGTLRFQVKGTFNFVSAFITFDTVLDEIKAECCGYVRHKVDMESIFDPYF